MKLEITDQKVFNSRPLLPKDIKQQWIDALFSGIYIQGEGYLNKDDKYCCLGCLVEIQNRPKAKWQQDSEEHIYAYDNRLGRIGPDNPLYNILRQHGLFQGFQIDSCVSLVMLNDLRKYTFQQIAEVIELYF